MYLVSGSSEVKSGMGMSGDVSSAHMENAGSFHLHEYVCTQTDRDLQRMQGNARHQGTGDTWLIIVCRAMCHRCTHRERRQLPPAAEQYLHRRPSQLVTDRTDRNAL